jgi:hypothetical protein
MEPRNIGVIVWSQVGVHARFYAGIPAYDGSRVELAKVPKFVEDRHGYAHWVKLWLDLTSRTDISPIRGGKLVSRQQPEFLEVLQGFSNDSYRLVDAGTVFDHVEDAEEAADYLFDILVADPAAMAIDEEPARERVDWVCSRLVQETEVTKNPDFHAHFSVTGVAGAIGPEELTFDYGYQGESRTRLYQRVPFPQQSSTIVRFAQSTRWMFEEARDRHVITSKDEATALIYVTPERMGRIEIRRAVNLLGARARVVNLYNERAVLKREWELLAQESTGHLTGPRLQL